MKSVKQKSSARIWTGKTMIWVEGTLQPFKKNVKLFNSERKWWLYYSKTHCTGSFPSKKKAVAWWENGGR